MKHYRDFFFYEADIMYDSENCIVELYRNVLEKEKRLFNLRDSSIVNAIKIMQDAYLPNKSWRSNVLSNSSVVDYDHPRFRCAYLHKYAMCYTGLVYHLLEKAFNSDEIYSIISSKSRLNICSLGGGPGTDIVGILAAIARNFPGMSFSTSIIDLARGWAPTFTLIINELTSRPYGKFNRIPWSNVECKYLCANLLEDWSPSIQQTIATADIVTMVKFVSAAACMYYTENMVRRIFRNMKPGALLLFVDNAAGGFDKMVENIAEEYGMASLYGPLLHYEYENSKFSITRFGFTSQSKSKVAFEVFQKPKARINNSVRHNQLRYYPENARYERRVHPSQGEESCNCVLVMMFIIFIIWICYIATHKK